MPSPRGAQPRRNFLTKALALLVGSVIGLVPLLTAGVLFFDPVRRRRKAVGATGDAIDEHGFIRVTSASSVPSDGSPLQLQVVADLQDYWNKFPDAAIGSVYLRRTEDGTFECFNARCPHLGCTVRYRPAEKAYICPCHESSFALDGTRQNEVPPRDMDSLEVQEREGEIWVKFQKFRAGIAERKVV